MLDDLFGGGGSATYRTWEDLSPETRGMASDISKRSLNLSTDAQARGEEVYGRNREALQRSAGTTQRMQGLAAGAAEEGMADYAQMGRPLLGRMYRQNVFSDAQKASKIEEAVGKIGAQHGQAEAAGMRQAADVAARYGLKFDPKQMAASAANRVGLMNQARGATKAGLDAREAAFYDAMAGQRAMGLGAAGQAGNLGGAAIGQVGGVQDVALGGIQGATQAMTPAAGIAQQAISSEFGQTPMVDQGDGGLFGTLAPVAMMGAGLYTGNPALFAAGAGSARRADGGPVYADGGEIGYADGGGIEVWPGVYAQPYADGGEIEDEEYEMEGQQMALERHDGAMTKGDGSGGKLHGPGTGISDSIPAITDRGEPIRVAQGEYVIPKDVVDILGEDFFENLIERLHTPAAIQRQQEVA